MEINNPVLPADEQLSVGITRRNLLQAGLIGLSGLLLADCGARQTSTAVSAGHNPTRSPLPTPSQEVPVTPSPESPADQAEILARAQLLKSYLPASHFVNHGPTEQSRLSITFDDFFSVEAAGYLEQLLKIANDKAVKFTFFPAGKALDQHRKAGMAEVWQQAMADGHAIGNHTYHHYIAPDPPHWSFAKLSPTQITSELALAQTALDDILGYDYPHFMMRPPGGSGGYTSPSLLAQHRYALAQVAEKDLCMTMWTSDSNGTHNDAGFLHKLATPGPEAATNGSIILIHPTNLTIAGVRTLVDWVTDQGMECTTVPELFAPQSMATPSPRPSGYLD